MYRIFVSNSRAEAKRTAADTLRELSPKEDSLVRLEEGNFVDMQTRGERKREFDTLTDPDTGNIAFFPLELPNLTNMAGDDRAVPTDIVEDHGGFFMWFLDTSNSLQLDNRLYPYRDLGGLWELALVGKPITKPTEAISSKEAQTWRAAVTINHYFGIRLGLPQYDNLYYHGLPKREPIVDFYGYGHNDWECEDIPNPIIEDMFSMKIRSLEDFKEACNRFWEAAEKTAPEENGYGEDTEEEEPEEVDDQTREDRANENYRTAKGLAFAMWVRYEFLRTESYSNLKENLERYKDFHLTKAEVAEYEKSLGYTIEEDILSRYGFMGATITGGKTAREIADYIEAPLQAVTKANRKREQTLLEYYSYSHIRQ